MKLLKLFTPDNTRRGISQLIENADNEWKNEAKAQIVTC
jgi:hypothetical protein